MAAKQVTDKKAKAAATAKINRLSPAKRSAPNQPKSASPSAAEPPKATAVKTVAMPATQKLKVKHMPETGTLKPPAPTETGKSKISLPDLDWKTATCVVCGKAFEYHAKKRPKVCRDGGCRYKFEYQIEPDKWAGHQTGLFDK